MFSKVCRSCLWWHSDLSNGQATSSKLTGQQQRKPVGRTFATGESIISSNTNADNIMTTLPWPSSTVQVTPSGDCLEVERSHAATDLQCRWHRLPTIMPTAIIHNTHSKRIMKNIILSYFGIHGCHTFSVKISMTFPWPPRTIFHDRVTSRNSAPFSICLLYTSPSPRD